MILTFMAFSIFPLYLLKSGGFQLVDVIIIVLSLIIIKSLDTIEISFGIYLIGPFIPYLFWVIVINSFAFMTSASGGGYIIASIQVLYCFFILVLFAVGFRRILVSRNAANFFYISLVAACITPWLLKQRTETLRGTLSFNNPNQLAYFSILILFMLILVNCITGLQDKKNHFQIISSILIISLTNIFVILSASRAGLISIVLLNIYYIYLIVRNNVGLLLFLIFSIISLSAFFSASMLNNIDAYIPHSSLDVFTKRLATKPILAVDDIYNRSIEQIKPSSDLMLVFGHGGWERPNQIDISDMYTKEVHNSILGILSNYGVVGMILFLIGWVLFIIRLGPYPYKSVLLLPIFIYNMSHYGLRFRLLWMALALLAASSFFNLNKNKQLN